MLCMSFANWCGHCTAYSEVGLNLCIEARVRFYSWTKNPTAYNVSKMLVCVSWIIDNHLLLSIIRPNLIQLCTLPEIPRHLILNINYEKLYQRPLNKIHIISNDLVTAWTEKRLLQNVNNIFSVLSFYLLNLIYFNCLIRCTIQFSRMNAALPYV